jgi:hypothetical protein
MPSVFATLGGLGGSAQRVAIAGMDDRTSDGRQRFARGKERREAIVAAQDQLGRGQIAVGDALGRGRHLGDPGGQHLVTLIDAAAGEFDAVRIVVLGLRSHRHGQRVPDVDRAAVLELRADDPAPRSGQPTGEHTRNQGHCGGALRRHAGGLSFAVLEMKGFNVARRQRQGLDVGRGDDMGDADRLADGDLGVGAIAIVGHRSGAMARGHQP